MGDKCPSCGEDSVVLEDAQRVCISCGMVVQEGAYCIDTLQLTANSNEHCSYARSLPTTFSERNSDIKRLALGFKEARNRLRVVQKLLRLTQSMCGDSLSYLTQALEHENFKSRPVRSKEILAGCCAYLVCRQNGWPILLRDVSVCLTGVTPNEVSKISKELKELLGISVTQPSLEELLPSVCRKADMPPQVFERALSIIQLCRDLWVTEGRQPDNIIYVVVFIAWQSLDFKERKKVKIHTFCQKYGLSAGYNKRLARERYKEIIAIIITLANQIPWNDTVTGESVGYHISDVLEYQQGLTRDAVLKLKRQSETVVLDHSTEGASSLSATETVNTENSSERNQATKGDGGEPAECTSLKSENKCTCDETQNVCMLSMNHKRQLPLNFLTEEFVPPSMLLVPKKRAKIEDEHIPDAEKMQPNEIIQDLNKEELGEEDIPNSDMHLYLKTEQEVKFCTLLSR